VGDPSATEGTRGDIFRLQICSGFAYGAICESKKDATKAKGASPITPIFFHETQTKKKQKKQQTLELGREAFVVRW
jgi:hypothetical protein